MANVWQKTLFYLGLVDEEEPGYEAGTSPSPAGGRGRRPEAHIPEPAVVQHVEPAAARVVPPRRAAGGAAHARRTAGRAADRATAPAQP
jgi:hypothetical protein